MKKVAILMMVIMLVAIVGMGAATAKQQENPSRAGNSSIYFYDVLASDTHGKGKLVIDVDKHTFVFNGQGFEPSAQIALRARAADSTDYFRFATGKANTAGNLHIAGTWGAGAAPADVVGYSYYPEIFGLWLKNDGAFWVRIACYYSTDGGTTWQESDHAETQFYGEENKVALWQIGVPEYALVKIHAVVEAGDDKTGAELFESVSSSVYGSGDPQYAYYTVSGTTQNTHISYNGILTWTGP
ncbi:MAG: hypothetical protein ACYDHW_01195 [Syntrophorhabdaceae bacterium]